jgi:hypothetical protein
VMWATAHILGCSAQLSAHDMKGTLISSSTHISRLWPGNFVWSWVSGSVPWKRCPSIGILRSLCQMGSTDAHTRT